MGHQQHYTDKLKEPGLIKYSLVQTKDVRLSKCNVRVSLLTVDFKEILRVMLLSYISHQLAFGADWMMCQVLVRFYKVAAPYFSPLALHMLTHHPHTVSTEISDCIIGADCYLKYQPEPE